MPGGGAQFSLFFPCNDLVPEAAAAQEGGAFRPSQTVLVVDDKSSLVRLAEEMLAGLGYEPVGFCSSEQALAAFKADPNRFILLLTDEVTPQLTGTTLASAVRAIRPQRPVVMASGYGGPQLAAVNAGLHPRSDAGNVDFLV